MRKHLFTFLALHLLFHPLSLTLCLSSLVLELPSKPPLLLLPLPVALRPVPLLPVATLTRPHPSSWCCRSRGCTPPPSGWLQACVPLNPSGAPYLPLAAVHARFCLATPPLPLPRHWWWTSRPAKREMRQIEIRGSDNGAHKLTGVLNIFFGKT